MHELQAGDAACCSSRYGPGAAHRCPESSVLVFQLTLSLRFVLFIPRLTPNCALTSDISRGLWETSLFPRGGSFFAMITRA
jgi:hypothetical protein